ncbi:MAG: DNA/RNA non-specific endonuclease [Bacteroidota bacterium]
MSTIKNVKGYRSDFLGTHLRVPLPTLSPKLLQATAKVKRARKPVLKYEHYSLIQHAERKFPILTASNIHGRYFQDIKRKDLFPSGRDHWARDPRIAEDQQFGMELYRADKSDFDRGHMVKREDVQWGRETEKAAKAARLTFFFTNAVPQHKNLNQKAWKYLENYILKEETMGHGLKINLFTGPVLDELDPLFVTEVKGEWVQIPTLFWKVVYFCNPQKQLTRIGFLMGQEKVLLREKIIQEASKKEGRTRMFDDFEDGDTYQVRVSLIESLTGITFPEAEDPYEDERPNKLILQQVQVRSLRSTEDTPSSSIKGLVW